VRHVLWFVVENKKKIVLRANQLSIINGNRYNKLCFTTATAAAENRNFKNVLLLVRQYSPYHRQYVRFIIRLTTVRVDFVIDISLKLSLGYDLIARNYICACVHTFKCNMNIITVIH